MNRNIPILLILIMVATAFLLLVSSLLSTSSVPSPFLIAATIVSTVALLGAVFSLYAEKRARNRSQQQRSFRY